MATQMELFILQYVASSIGFLISYLIMQAVQRYKLSSNSKNSIQSVRNSGHSSGHSKGSNNENNSQQNNRKDVKIGFHTKRVNDLKNWPMIWWEQLPPAAGDAVCGICLDKLYGKVTIYPCEHTFDYKCLQEYRLEHGSEIKNCPRCHTHIEAATFEYMPSC